MHPYIDIHTHLPDPPDGNVTICNRLSDFDSLPATGWYSVGLHPWYLDENSVNAAFAKMESAAKAANILAIGECGIDLVCSTPPDLQRRWFRQQIELAESLNKPLIIHCVRAFDEVLRLLSDQCINCKAIFHGFNKSRELAQRIVSEGHYLSLGKHLQDEKMIPVIRSIPNERLFLETDSSGLSIRSIYRMAAAALGVDVETLVARITMNFEHVFSTSLPES